MLAYWLIGFAIQMGGVGGVANLGGAAPLNAEWSFNLFGKSFGIFGQHGLFLTQGGTYDVAVMVLFLFQMVFMDTALTIVTGSAAERWKYAAFLISSFIMGAFTYPLFANWAWGGGWLATLGSNFGLGKGYCDFAGSGVVHAMGGIIALAGAMVRAWCTPSGASRRWRFPSSWARASASIRAKASPMPSSATISCSYCSAVSSWPSAGLDSIRVPPWAPRPMAACASAPSR